jgi:hypothetical protein
VPAALLATVATLFVPERDAVFELFVYATVIVGVPAPVALEISTPRITPTPFVEPSESRASHAVLLIVCALVLVIVKPLLCQIRSQSNSSPACADDTPENRARCVLFDAAGIGICPE